MEINEDQQEALDEFFEELYTDVENKAKKEYEDKIVELEESLETSNESLESAITLEQAEAAYAKAKEDFMEEGQKVLDTAQEDMTKEYSEKFAVVLEDVYSEIHDKVEADFLESDEYQAFEKAREALKPVIMAESDNDLVQEINKLKTEKKEILEEKEELSRKETINSLIVDFKEKEQKIISDFLENAKDEDEIYERFNTVIALLESGDEDESEEDIDDEENDEDEVEGEESDDDESDDEEEDDDDKEVAEEDDKIVNQSTADAYFESTSNVIDFKEKKENKLLSKKESEIIDAVFG